MQKGLYSATITCVVYIIMGTSMHLAVGPLASVSLLVGRLVVEYAPLCSWSKNPPCPNIVADPMPAVYTANQAALSIGILVLGVGLLNGGKLISFVAKPVIYGFTAAISMNVAMSQLKDAFGFII